MVPAMRHLILLPVLILLGACTSQIDSVGAGATYMDPNTGATYGGNVNVRLRDRDPKNIHRPVQAMKPGTAVGLGLARLLDGPCPDPTLPTLEQIWFPR